MVNRKSKSGGRARKNDGLMGAVKRHPIRTAGIAAGAVLGLTLIGKAVAGGDDERGAKANRDGESADGARRTAGRGAKRGGARSARGARGGRGAARGGRAAGGRAGGRSQSRAESGRTSGASEA